MKMKKMSTAPAPAESSLPPKKQRREIPVKKMQTAKGGVSPMPKSNYKK